MAQKIYASIGNIHLIAVDDIQWGIRRGSRTISYHTDSESLAMRWREITGQELEVDLPARRKHQFQMEKENEVQAL